MQGEIGAGIDIDHRRRRGWGREFGLTAGENRRTQHRTCQDYNPSHTFPVSGRTWCDLALAVSLAGVREVSRLSENAGQLWKELGFDTPVRVPAGRHPGLRQDLEIAAGN